LCDRLPFEKVECYCWCTELQKQSSVGQAGGLAQEKINKVEKDQLLIGSWTWGILANPIKGVVCILRWSTKSSTKGY